MPSQQRQPRYRAYCDESGFPAERYQAIAAVSGSEEELLGLRDLLREALDELQVTEAKWAQAKGHRPKVQVVYRFLGLALDAARSDRLRIDVLSWDTQDSRHAVCGRDDVANLHRMYYHLLVQAARMWPQGMWQIFPDEHTAMDWGEIRDFVGNTRRARRRPELLTLFADNDRYRFFDFRRVAQVSSVGEPLVQLADVFAGLALFSRNKGSECLRWIAACESAQHPRLPGIEDDLDAEDVAPDTKADRTRFELLRWFDNECKKRKLGVSLRDKQYLWTPSPGNPISFWPYVPQHESDKAPTG